MIQSMCEISVVLQQLALNITIIQGYILWYHNNNTRTHIWINITILDVDSGCINTLERQKLRSTNINSEEAIVIDRDNQTLVITCCHAISSKYQGQQTTNILLIDLIPRCIDNKVAIVCLNMLEGWIYLSDQEQSTKLDCIQKINDIVFTTQQNIKARKSKKKTIVNSTVIAIRCEITDEDANKDRTSHLSCVSNQLIISVGQILMFIMATMYLKKRKMMTVIIIWLLNGDYNDHFFMLRAAFDCALFPVVCCFYALWYYLWYDAGNNNELFRQRQDILSWKWYIYVKCKKNSVDFCRHTISPYIAACKKKIDNCLRCKGSTNFLSLLLSLFLLQ